MFVGTQILSLRVRLCLNGSSNSNSVRNITSNIRCFKYRTIFSDCHLFEASLVVLIFKTNA